MSHSTIFADVRRGAMTVALALLLGLPAGCGPARVAVQGNFPAPLVEPYPLTMGLWYGEDFRQHEFTDEAKEPNESSWVVQTGDAQVDMWDTLFAGMFASTVHMKDKPGRGRMDKVVDGVLIPHVEELQYAIPAHTSIKVYEIWLRYRFELVSSGGQPIAEWTLTSYGKTPTAFMQSDEEAVNLAAVMALRDAGANFVTTFARVPGVGEWLQQRRVAGEKREQAP